jgi:tetratricopeptide (TPR) repeat protein
LDSRIPDSLEQAIIILDGLSKKELTQTQEGTLYYFMANAWSNIRKLRRKEISQYWEYKKEKLELENEIICLRRALKNRCFEGPTKNRKCEILTNLGNLMNEIGRFPEAIEYWDRALGIDPSFAMAHGNKGRGLTNYAGTLYDNGHQLIFLKYAYLSLEKGLSSNLPKDARERFNEYKKWIDSLITPERIKEDIDMHRFSLGESKEEIAYRKWCLRNRLFLNPLNDLGPYPIAARDILHTPTITTKIEEGPCHEGYFNQLKQEFVSARYLYYEGINSHNPHFSDKEVYLYDTLDYPAYSLALEKVKIAFRINYSIFDKIAYFLNDYLKLSIPEKRVKFGTLWYNSQNKDKGLRQEFRQSKNLPLMGLFWLSKDLYERESGFKEAIEPDAQELSEIRNHLEHKYFKIHEYLFESTHLEPIGLADTLAYSMRRLDFKEKTLRLMKIIRASIIYLSGTIHYEEKLRAKKRQQEKIWLKTQLDLFNDDWKR